LIFQRRYFIFCRGDFFLIATLLYREVFFNWRTFTMLRASYASAIVLMTMLIAQLSVAQDPVGEITKVNGSAKLTRGATQLEPASAMPVVVGDRIQTSKSAQVTVTFLDGSRAELGEESSVTIDRYALAGPTRKASMLALWAGRLRTIVKLAAGIEPNFEVHTPNAVVAVRGTDFETAFIDDRPCPEDRTCMRYTTVGVSRGLVAVSNPSTAAATVEVGEGYETTVACAAAPTAPAPLGMGDLGAPGYH
jgi:hypothetical protein